MLRRRPVSDNELVHLVAALSKEARDHICNYVRELSCWRRATFLYERA